MKIKSLAPEYVDHLPDLLEEGVLYISEEFATAAHKCCCGCGEEVITPLNKARWRLEKYGDQISIRPSIGNWKFACQSHYWISRNQVVPSYPMTEKAIERVFKRDRRDKDRYIAEINRVDGDQGQARDEPVPWPSERLDALAQWVRARLNRQKRPKS